MGMQPLVPSAVPCPCPCSSVVYTVKGMIYKPIVSGPGPSPVPAPMQCE